MYEIERDGKAQKVQTSISHQAASCHHHQHSAFEIFVIMIEFLIFITSLQSSAKKRSICKFMHHLRTSLLLLAAEIIYLKLNNC